LQGYIFRILQHFATKLCNFTYALSSCGDLLASPCLVLRLVYNGNCLLHGRRFDSCPTADSRIFRNCSRLVRSKAWFPHGRNCRERVVTVVRVVRSSRPNGNMKKVSSRHVGNSSRQLQQCRRDRLAFYLDDSCDRPKTCRDGYFLMETEKRQRGNSLSSQTCRQLLLRSLGTKHYQKYGTFCSRFSCQRLSPFYMPNIA
jgi:hypothetical protein